MRRRSRVISNISTVVKVDLSVPATRISNDVDFVIPGEELVVRMPKELLLTPHSIAFGCAVEVKSLAPLYFRAHVIRSVAHIQQCTSITTDDCISIENVIDRYDGIRPNLEVLPDADIVAKKFTITFHVAPSCQGIDNGDSKPKLLLPLYEVIKINAASLTGNKKKLHVRSYCRRNTSFSNFITSLVLAAEIVWTDLGLPSIVVDTSCSFDMMTMELVKFLRLKNDLFTWVNGCESVNIFVQMIMPALTRLVFHQGSTSQYAVLHRLQLLSQFGNAKVQHSIMKKALGYATSLAGVYGTGMLVRLKSGLQMQCTPLVVVQADHVRARRIARDAPPFVMDPATLAEACHKTLTYVSGLPASPPVRSTGAYNMWPIAIVETPRLSESQTAPHMILSTLQACVDARNIYQVDIAPCTTHAAFAVISNGKGTKKASVAVGEILGLFVGITEEDYNDIRSCIVDGCMEVRKIPKDKVNKLAAEKGTTRGQDLHCWRNLGAYHRTMLINESRKLRDTDDYVLRAKREVANLLTHADSKLSDADLGRATCVWSQEYLCEPALIMTGERPAYYTSMHDLHPSVKLRCMLPLRTGTIHESLVGLWSSAEDQKCTVYYSCGNPMYFSSYKAVSASVMRASLVYPIHAMISSLRLLIAGIEAGVECTFRGILYSMKGASHVAYANKVLTLFSLMGHTLDEDDHRNVASWSLARVAAYKRSTRIVRIEKPKVDVSVVPARKRGRKVRTTIVRNSKTSDSGHKCTSRSVGRGAAKCRRKSIRYMRQVAMESEAYPASSEHAPPLIALAQPINTCIAPRRTPAIAGSVAVNKRRTATFISAKRRDHKVDYRIVMPVSRRARKQLPR